MVLRASGFDVYAARCEGERCVVQFHLDEPVRGLQEGAIDVTISLAPRLVRELMGELDECLRTPLVEPRGHAGSGDRVC